MQRGRCFRLGGLTLSSSTSIAARYFSPDREQPKMDQAANSKALLIADPVLR
jgi:hypothetical protein